MPKGELYIKTIKMQESADDTGIVSSSDSVFAGWADAYLRYGLSLSDGGRDKIETAAPHKSPVGVKSAVSHGVSYNGSTVGIIDERTISFDAHITAGSASEYQEKWVLFRDEVLSKDGGGVVVLRLSDEPDVIHCLLYQTHEQFRQWKPCGAGMFTLSFIEPHPELRSFSLVMSPHTDSLVKIPVTFGTEETYSAVANAGSISWQSSDVSKAALSSSVGGTVTCSYVGVGNVTITSELRIAGIVVACDRCNLTVLREAFEWQ